MGWMLGAATDVAALLFLLLAGIWVVGFLLSAIFNPNRLDTSYQDRIVREYIEREERGERQPIGGLWFHPTYLERWKREHNWKGK